jgi:nicotinamidase-related amidase
MQRDFIDKGAPIECPGGREIIPNIQRLLDLARQKGLTVIYTQEAHRAQGVDFGRELDGEEPVHCVEGTPGVEIVPDLAPQPRDFVIVKRRYSAFFATDLDLLLRGLGVDTLILTGAATDVCVRATAQDGQQLNYWIIVPEECVAGTSVEQHHAALHNIAYILGKVLPLEKVMLMLEQETGAV